MANPIPLAYTIVILIPLTFIGIAIYSTREERRFDAQKPHQQPHSPREGGGGGALSARTTRAAGSEPDIEAALTGELPLPSPDPHRWPRRADAAFSFFSSSTEARGSEMKMLAPGSRAGLAAQVSLPLPSPRAVVGLSLAEPGSSRDPSRSGGLVGSQEWNG
jgi:hypothetical protein